MADDFAPAAWMSSKLAFTTAAVSGVPSEKVTPGRSVNVKDFASSLICQDCANHGITSPVAGSCSVSESTICRVTYQVSLPLPVPLGFRLIGSLATAKVSVPPLTGAVVSGDEASIEPEGAVDAPPDEPPESAVGVPDPQPAASRETPRATARARPSTVSRVLRARR